MTPRHTQLSSLCLTAFGHTNAYLLRDYLRGLTFHRGEKTTRIITVAKNHLSPGIPNESQKEETYG